MLRCTLSWADGVVPLPVEAAGAKANLGQLCVRDLSALGVRSLVDLGPHSQARLGSGRGDEVHNRHQARQRAPTPVGADVREEPVLDLVPLAGPRREVADGDGQPRGVGQPLEFPLPEAHPGPIEIGRAHV